MKLECDAHVVMAREVESKTDPHPGSTRTETVHISMVGTLDGIITLLRDMGLDPSTLKKFNVT